MAVAPLFSVDKSVKTVIPVERPVKVCIFGTSHIKRVKTYLDSKNITNLGLNPGLCTVQIFGYGGLKVRNDPHRRFFKNNPDVNPSHLARDIFSFAAYIFHGWNPKCVVISQILPRQIAPHGFNDNVDCLNKHLYTLCSNTHGINLWRHKAGLTNYHKYPYAADGIHLSVDVGYPLYSRSLGDAILRHIKWFCVRE